MFNLIPFRIKLFIGLLIFFIFILIVFIIASPSPQQPLQPSAAPIQTPGILPYQEPNYTGPEPKSVYQTPLPEYDEAVKINELNGLLLEKLPYSGNDFSLRYDGKKNSFIATYNQNNEAQGRAELLNFLKVNNIESTDWLINFQEEVL